MLSRSLGFSKSSCRYLAHDFRGTGAHRRGRHDYVFTSNAPRSFVQPSNTELVLLEKVVRAKFLTSHPRTRKSTKPRSFINSSSPRFSRWLRSRGESRATNTTVSIGRTLQKIGFVSKGGPRHFARLDAFRARAAWSRGHPLHGWQSRIWPQRRQRKTGNRCLAQSASWQFLEAHAASLCDVLASSSAGGGHRRACMLSFSFGPPRF
jgi:hypothetical protein